MSEPPVSATSKTSLTFTEDMYRQCVRENDNGNTPLPALADLKYGQADLNGDGRLETLVLMTDINYCGNGGCTAFLCSDQGGQISSMTVTREPVLLSDHATNGWKDFYVWSDGSLRLMAYDGKRYPGNPSVAPKYDQSVRINKAEQLVRNSEIFIQDGYQLKRVEEVPIFQSADVFAFSFLHYGDPDFQYLVTVNVRTEQVEISTRPLR